MKEYTLHRDKRVEPNDPDDFDMSRPLGSVIRFITPDKLEWHGEVQEVKAGLGCIIVSHGRYFFECSNQVSEIWDNRRCNSCGYYFCTCAIPSISSEQTETKPTELMTPITSEALAAKEDGDAINCVEGKLIKLYDKNAKTGDGQYGPYYFVDGVIELDDKATSDIKFKLEGPHESVKFGNRLRITCHEGPKGKSGIKMEEEEYPKGSKKIKRRIVVTKTATITHFEHGAEKATTSSEVSQPSGGATPPSNRPQTQGNGHPLDIRSEVDNRLRVLGWVQKGYEATKEGYGLPELTPEHLISLTHSIIICSHRHEVMGKVAKPGDAEVQSTETPQADATVGEDGWPPESSMEKTTPKQEKPKLPGWKDHIHPKLKKPLGELDTLALARMAKWSFENARPEDEDEAKEWLEAKESRHFQGQINLMIGEKAWTPKKVLSILMADSQEAKDGKFEDAAFEALFKDMTEEEATEHFADMEGVIEKLVKLHKKLKAKAPKDDVESIPY